MKPVRLAACVGPLVVLAFACAPKAPSRPPVSGGATPPSGVPSPTAAPPSSPLVAVDERALDKGVSPCDDFYSYACGTWMKSTPIPEDQPDWMRSFDVIFERNETMLREILEKDGKEPDPKAAYAREIGDYYAACMDEAAIEAADTKPVQKLLAKVDALKDTTALARLLAELHQGGVGALFDFDSGQDFKDATEEIGVASQAGLGLPDRDYYLKDDDKTKELRAKYEAHVAATFQLAGSKPDRAAADAKAVLRLETELARSSMSKVDQRDPKKIYHRVDLKGLKELAPTFAWDDYLKALGFPQITAINVAEPEFFKAIDKAMRAAKAGAPALSAWKTYVKWHVLRAASPRLPKRFVDEDFQFKSALTGAPKILPRWKRCVRATDAALGEALAQPYVERTLGAEGKATAQSMIGEVEASMRRNLEKLPWMDEPTRKAALEKLEAIANKVGYPDVWRRYEGLVVERSAYLDNALRAAAFEVHRRLDKIGKPVDKKEWEMTPPTVNAYYDPSLNEMVFPAGILQPPFYGNQQSLATNFGGIGMVMGHELTHGFDDEGRQFDAKGNMREWWTDKVSKEFDGRASCVKKQFDGYVAVDDLHVKGDLTLGENIADLGGVKLALAAYQHAVQGKRAESIGGFTPEQQFFLGYAQSWCGNVRKEMVRLMAQTNPHSPPKFRVNGPLSNLPEFARAFSCKDGSPMVRSAGERCEVW